MAKGREKRRRREKKMIKKGLDPAKIRAEKKAQKVAKAKRAARQG